LRVVLHVLVEIQNESQIAEVPVECRLSRRGGRSNSGHDDVAAIARITGDDETPGFGRLLRQDGRLRE
jgi:hypothetical protein